MVVDAVVVVDDDVSLLADVARLIAGERHNFRQFVDGDNCAKLIHCCIAEAVAPDCYGM